MLAKIWKKALLVVCILFCVYNVMHKLISRKPLEFQLKSVQNQSSIIDMLETNNNKTEPVTDNSSVVKENTNQAKPEETQANENNNSIVVIY